MRIEKFSNSAENAIYTRRSNRYILWLPIRFALSQKNRVHRTDEACKKTTYFNDKQSAITISRRIFM
ncbi:MAG: hypothetical protein EB127_24090 [Alphaproteobacteria bacterium]|nr:hypothetical protein [Alphaproteobacteria bacterium]